MFVRHGQKSTPENLNLGWRFDVWGKDWGGEIKEGLGVRKDCVTWTVGVETREA